MNASPSVEELLSLPLEAGKRVDPSTGKLADDPDVSVSFEPIPVRRGDFVSSDIVPYRLHFYGPDLQHDLIYTYAYDSESNYLEYHPERSDPQWKTGMTEILSDGYLRVEVLKNTSQKLNELVSMAFDGDPNSRYSRPVFFREEDGRLKERLEKIRDEEDTVLLIAADSHYGFSPVYTDQIADLQAAASIARPDLFIHLGDLTDGALSGEKTKRFARRILRDLKSMGVPFEMCIGNHDFNYFKGNPDVFSREECEQLYLDGKKEDRFVDLEDKHLRLIFLSSYDPKEKQRYGFYLKTAFRLWNMLRTTPKGYRILVFSHVPPLPEIHYWSQEIRNSSYILRVLEQRQAVHHDILAYIHGHNHADQVYRARSFPIVGIGSMKPEYFTDKKPYGSETAMRAIGNRTQELFDVAVIKKDRIEFLRYGAGEDRTLT